MGDTTPRWRGTRPLKRWRYVGVYDASLMACFGCVELAGIPQRFWAVWDREARVLHERTSFGPRRVRMAGDRVEVADGLVEADLRLDPDTTPIEVTSRHGRHDIWTRKTGARAVGTIRLGGVAHHVDARALIDDTAGHHARETDWLWSAGIGESADGRALMWNLVDGVHDGPLGTSERFVWVDGEPFEVGPVTFADDLGEVRFAEDGAVLSFASEAVRERHEDLKVVRSDYVQPFGTFTGWVPRDIGVARGFGVMERHSARW